MHTRLFLLWAALVCYPLHLPQITHVLSQLKGSELAARGPRVEVPLQLYRDYLIVIQGSLGTLGPLNFLIDTGANPTAVNRRTAKRLGLHRDESTKLTLLNQNVELDRVVLPSIQLGPIRAESLPGVIQDLDSIESFLQVRIDAIIGFDVLSQSSFAIDYRSKKILFGPIEASALSIPLHSGPATFTVQLQIQDQPVSLLVDTGTADLLLFECQLPRKLRGLPTRGVKRVSNNGGKQLELREVWLPNTRLGVADFGVTTAFVTDDNINCGRSLDGVVGPVSLGLRWIAFDFDHGTFDWKR
jgi:predicted aspartyl protease